MLSAKPYISIILFLILSIQINPVINSISITLSSSMEKTQESSYEISKKKIVTLNDTETYIISGSCSECGIKVEEEASLNITLNNVSIDNNSTGPLVIKKNANVNLILKGTSTLINNFGDEDEKAGIKIKSGSTLTISGDGTLIVYGYSKNGIKGASKSNLIINSGTFKVYSVNNAIASDNSVTINGGTFNIETSEGDGIKSDPDDTDSESLGSITISDGTFNISSFNDGIQAKNILAITGGTFNIKTFKDGSSSTTFDKDQYSAKGIKVSTNKTSSMEISGGTFYLDTSDQAIHSDGDITITGGTFFISALYNGIHSDQWLLLGKNGDSNSNIKLNITKSKKGLKAAQINIYSGTYNFTTSDDGINSGGDNVTTCDDCNDINIYGGDIYVNAEEDGLDADRNINIYGGNIEVWGAQQGSDGDFVKFNGTVSITGGTFFAGGNAEKIDPSNWNNNYKYIFSDYQLSPKQVVQVMSGSNLIKRYTSPKNVSHIYYTSSAVDDNYQFVDYTDGTNASRNLVLKKNLLYLIVAILAI